MRSDAELLLTWRSGRNPQALCALCQRWEPHVRGLCAHFLGGETADVDDAANEVLFLMAEHAASIDADGLDPWLYRVAKNVCSAEARSAARRRKRQYAYGNDRSIVRRFIVKAGQGPSDAEIALEQAIEGLDLTQRAVLMLHHAQGHTIEQTAALLHLTRPQVKQQLEDAKCNVRQFFWENDIPFPPVRLPAETIAPGPAPAEEDESVQTLIDNLICRQWFCVGASINRCFEHIATLGASAGLPPLEIDRDGMTKVGIDLGELVYEQLKKNTFRRQLERFLSRIAPRGVLRIDVSKDRIRIVATADGGETAAAGRNKKLFQFSRH